MSFSNLKLYNDTLDRFNEIQKLSCEKSIVQLTSFGPTGIVICEFLNQVNLLGTIPTIFIDTLFHFKETYELIERIKEKYPLIKLDIGKPLNCTNETDFNEKYGYKLWETKPSKYSYYTKIEPRDRMMRKYESIYYINGRRRSQGYERSKLELYEITDEYTRIQPLYDWDENDIWNFINENQLPYNTLHKDGYRSIGDYHSTYQNYDDKYERSGRKWNIENQTECGLHITKKRNNI